MDHGSYKPNSVFVLFGAGGDLARRMIVPALFNLHLDGLLPEGFRILGVDRQESGDEQLAERYLDGVRKHSRRGNPDSQAWKTFAQGIHYMQADLMDSDAYKSISAQLEDIEKELGGRGDHIFYMATPPALFGPIATGLGGAGLARDRHRARIVVEKPLGHDLESFQQINRALRHYFKEPQIFRIDHFLGKETVQNILALRFANPMFEPVWNRRYIDHVAITVAETLGVGHRGGYYEKAGALRDMVQNHLMQILCLIAMEPPVAYNAADIRDKKMDVMHALRPITGESVDRCAARGQYGPGWLNGEKVPGYREEPDVAQNSSRETYAALKLHVDNWRWQDVPFYLRTGKRLSADVSEVSIRFRDVPHCAFPDSSGINTHPARLVIQIQPEEGVVVKFMAKEPGTQMRLRPVNMRFSYQETFKTSSPAAYETLLRELMGGDATLFMRSDQVEAAWRLLTPVLERWDGAFAPDFPNYTAGSWGPESSEVMVARDGNIWLTPTLMNGTTG
ncbi:MAG TPA: glucose-6-phosphate dehydrogenase [Gammaproteobacteria bacterium]|nr:glucose-6-phosphate dehydrogenase [Gammaproteobacteria bacterium]